MRRVIVSRVTVQSCIVTFHGMDDWTDEALLDLAKDDPPNLDDEESSTSTHYSVIERKTDENPISEET